MRYESKKPEEWDQGYVTKFGALKKAAILYSFRRYTDSLNIIEQLKKQVDSEQSSNDERFISLDKKWRAKLQIGQEIPKDILNYEITQEVLNYFKINIPLSTLLVYVEKMRKGNCFSIYNRHTFLNGQVLQFYKTVQKTMGKYQVDLKTIKVKISEINQWTERKEKLKTENPELYKKFSIKYRAEMCPNIVKTGKCSESYRNCKFAHNPNVLNLTLVDKQKKLLANSLNETQKQTKNSKILVPWNYPKQNIYQQGLKFDKTLVANYSTERKYRSRSEKRNKSVDISKMRINFHEL